jgi:hypothetical protein
MLPEYARAAVIHGTIPGWARPLDDQELRIRVNGQMAAREYAPFGDFAIEVPLRPGRACVLQIDAEKYVVPEEQGLGPDRRRLAWQMRRIEPVR